MERSLVKEAFLAPVREGASDAEVIAALRLTIKQVQETLLPNQEELPQITNVTFDVFYTCMSNHERFGDALAISLGDVAGHGGFRAKAMQS